MTIPATSEGVILQARALVAAQRDITPVRLAETIVNGAGTNDSPALRARFAAAIRAGLWAPGESWCSIWATTLLHELWPGAYIWTAGCSEQGAYAKRKGVLVSEPEPGAIFLLGQPVASHPFHHTGFCVSRNADGSWTTYEGNTNVDGSSNGWGCFQRTRHFHALDRFSLWHHLVVLGG